MEHADGGKRLAGIVRTSEAISGRKDNEGKNRTRCELEWWRGKGTEAAGAWMFPERLADVRSPGLLDRARRDAAAAGP